MPERVNMHRGIQLLDEARSLIDDWVVIVDLGCACIYSVHINGGR